MFKKKKQFVTFQKFENNFFFENKVPNEEFVSPVVCIWVSIPPTLKNTPPPLSCQALPGIGKLSKAPFLGNPPSILVFYEPPT